MANHTDILATLLTLEGDSAFLQGMNRIGTAVMGFTERNRGMLTVLATFGPQIGRWGEKLLELANESAEAAGKAGRVENELEALFKHQGYSEEDIDKVKKYAHELQELGGISYLTAEKASTLMASFAMKPDEFMPFLPYITMQADMYGASVESVAIAVGKAFGSGNVGMLARYGVTMDMVTKAELKRLAAIQLNGTEAEKAAARQKSLELVLKALRDNVAPLESRMKTLRGIQGRYNATMEEFAEKMGSGIVAARKFGYSVGYDVARVLNTLPPEMASAGGGIMYVAGNLLKGVGAAGEFAHRLLSLTATMKILQAGEMGANAARLAGIPVTTMDTAAKSANAAAAGAGAAANLSLAAALWGVVAPLLVIVELVMMAALWWRNLKVAMETHKEKDYAKKTEEETEQMLKARGWTRDKSGAVIKDTKSTEESRAAAKKWLEEHQGEETDLSFRTGSDKKGKKRGEGRQRLPQAGAGSLPENRPTVTPDMSEEATMDEYEGAGEVPAGEGGPMGEASATRMPGGTLRVVTDVKGGAGVNEDDLRNYELSAQ